MAHLPSSVPPLGAMSDLECLLEGSQSPFCVLGSDGRLRRTNAAGAQLLGDGSALPPDKLWAQLFSADDQEPARAALAEAIATGALQTVTTRCCDRDGAQRWITWELSPATVEPLVYALGHDRTVQRQVEERLRLLEPMVEQAAIGMVLTDLEGRITYANAAMRATYGYGDELIGMTVPQIIVPEEGDVIQAGLAELRANGYRKAEMTYLCRDGSRRPGSVAALLIRDADGAPVASAALIRDLTDERAHAQQLRVFEALVEHMPDAISVNSFDGTLTYANQAFRAQLGITGPAHELTIMQVVDPAELPRMEAEVWPRMAAGGSWRGRTRLRRLDGTTFPTESLSFPIHDAQGEIQAFAGVMRDVTEQERVEQELRLAKFSLDRLPDNIHWIDPSSAIVYVNDGACRMLGYMPEELLGMTIADIDPVFPVHEWSAVWNNLKQQGVLCFETLHRRYDGSTFPVEIVSSFLEFEGHEYACVLARDLSERKRAEDERAALQGQIIAAQQVALRELSTPLIPIADGVVVMPLIGAIDSARAQQVLETLLTGVAERHARVAILDITGVAVVDTQVASALVRAAQAIRMLGARVILTGIRPEVAQTLVHLGADLGSILTLGSLQSGVAYALRGV